MHYFRSTPRSLVIALAAGSVALTGVALSACLHGTFATGLWEGHNAPHRVANRLDEIVQRRFGELAPIFGTSRIATTVTYGHNLALFHGKNDWERTLVRAANDEDLNYIVMLLHCAPVPGRSEASTLQTARLQHSADVLFFKYPIVAKKPSPYQQPESTSFNLPDGDPNKVFRRAAVDWLPQLMKGQAAETTSGNWLVVMRPIPAAASCTGCHTSAKVGDTLGIMVYGVEKEAS